MIEGDITPDSYTRYVMGWEHEEPTGDLLLHDGSRKKKATYTNDPKRIWPDGIIPFRIGAYIGRQIFIINPICTYFYRLA